jgi:hypothetical protein
LSCDDTNTDKALEKSLNKKVFVPKNKNVITLDVTKLTPTQAARAILESEFTRPQIL